MKTLLLGICLITSLMGFFLFMAARGAVHEIGAFILFLMAVVALVGYGVIGAIESLRDKQ